MRIFARRIRTDRAFKPEARWREVEREINKELDVAKKDVLTYYQKIVASWEHKPTFVAIRSVTRGNVELYVEATGPNAKIWGYVNEGTRPHRIEPKKAGGLLVFQWGGKGSYKAKTGTSGQYKGPGVVVNPTTQYRKGVNHPGNKPRNFHKAIARWYGKRFRRNMTNGIRRGIRRKI